MIIYTHYTQEYCSKKIINNLMIMLILFICLVEKLHLYCHCFSLLYQLNLNVWLSIILYLIVGVKHSFTFDSNILCKQMIKNVLEYLILTANENF